MMDVDNKVLLNIRADKMKLFPKGWVLPGGHLELGETIDIAALRELEEECGVKVDHNKETNTYSSAGMEVTVEPFFLFESSSAKDISLKGP